MNLELCYCIDSLLIISVFRGIGAVFYLSESGYFDLHTEVFSTQAFLQVLVVFMAGGKGGEIFPQFPQPYDFFRER
jgi:hypothetical protein